MDQLVVGQGSGGCHLIAKLVHIARGVRGLNSGGSRILGFVIRSAYVGLVLRLDLDVLRHVPVMVANKHMTIESCAICRRMCGRLEPIIMMIIIMIVNMGGEGRVGEGRGG